MEPLALTISQAAQLGGPCRSALYEDIREGRLRAVKRGRSTQILIDDFRKYLAALPSINPAPPPVDDSRAIGWQTAAVSINPRHRVRDSRLGSGTKKISYGAGGGASDGLVSPASMQHAQKKRKAKP